MNRNNSLARTSNVIDTIRVNNVFSYCKNVHFDSGKNATLNDHIKKQNHTLVFL